jgi:hypothetical protein
MEISSITPPIFGSITCANSAYWPGNRPVESRGVAADSRLESCRRSAAGSADGQYHGAAGPLTWRARSFRTDGGRTQGDSHMTGSGRSLLRQASVVLVVCCACVVAAGPAFAQDRAPEPAPPNTSTPKPEAPPSAQRQPTPKTVTRVTPPPAPPAAPPPPPPPAAVTPPPPTVVTPVVSQPPPAPVRSESRIQRPKTPKPRPKSEEKKPEPKVQQEAVGAPLPGLSREKATSPDTMLLAGGLALFVLVLADMVFLTLSTRVMRAR